jgi:hypothetical protein
MASQITDNYYVSKQAILLRLFDKLMVRVVRSLRRDYGDEFTDKVVPEMRKRFEEIIPEIPYLGGMKNVFTEIIVLNGMLVAIHQVLREHGCEVEETICLYCEISIGMFEALPQALLHAGGKLMLSKPAKWLFERQAARSQVHQFPEDWVYTYVEGDGQTFDHGLKFTECAVIKFYEAQGVQELTRTATFLTSSWVGRWKWAAYATLIWVLEEKSASFNISGEVRRQYQVALKVSFVNSWMVVRQIVELCQNICCKEETVSRLLA